MFFFLPFFFFIFSSVIIRPYFENWRATILFAGIISAAVLTGITEILSLSQSFSFYPVMIVWLLLAFFTGLKVFPLRNNLISHLNINFSEWSLNEKRLLGIILFICMVTALTASVGAPNTWDAMTYHLSRVEHWVQNKTVGFYPTHITRQLYISPWAEFAIAQARILGAGEASANFIQWTSMAGSLIGVSLIARQLGANRLGQLMAVVLAACLPMGILQSVSTQNDYVESFWLTVFVFFLMEAQRKFTLINFMAVGLSLGLAFLTKGYSYIFTSPFLAWFIGMNFKQKLAPVLRGWAVIIICVVSLNIGQCLRNTQAFGTPFGPSTFLINQSFDLKVLWVNALRNMSIHLATPWRDVNNKMAQTMTRAARLLGADMNDPQSMFGGEFAIERININEDYSGNFLHTILFLIVIVMVWFYRGPKKMIGTYILGILSSFLLFCLIVRFQPWHSRFHLPLFVLFCPVAGVVLERFLRQKSLIMGILFLIGALPWLFLNIQHPWFGDFSIWYQPRSVQYFYKHPDLISPYNATAQYIKSLGCTQVGMIMGEDSWEYPWWILLATPHLRIEHIEVKNASASLKYPLGDFQACALIIQGGQATQPMKVGGAEYKPAWWVPAGVDKITVYLRKP